MFTTTHMITETHLLTDTEVVHSLYIDLAIKTLLSIASYKN